MGANSIAIADMDNDNDFDVISASIYDHKIAWYENSGNGNFGNQQILSMETIGAADVTTADLDNDGFQDIISAALFDHNIAWFKNDGTGNFGNLLTISNETNLAQSVYTADLDGDGDMDVLSASQDDHKIAWYENLLITVGIEANNAANTPQLFSVYPNPTHSTLQLTLHQPSTKATYILYNTLGEQLMAGAFATASHTLKIADLASGVYFVQLHHGQKARF